jgi:CMP-N,N'-diacetyllegionaminic acid synthase
MKILGVICARGGSKGLKNKNIRDLNGKPLISYTIDVLRAWGKTTRIVCSTDSPEIARIANEYGGETPFLRPLELASDAAPKIPVLQHALRFCEEEDGFQYDVVVDMQPTSPFRQVQDIDGAFSEFLRTRADVLYSVYESKVNPYFTMVELDNKGYARLSKQLKGEFHRRQDAPKVYSINGSIYVYDRTHLLNTKALHCENERVYVMNEISSIDIDSELDFQFADFIMKSGYFNYEFS